MGGIVMFITRVCVVPCEWILRYNIVKIISRLKIKNEKIKKYLLWVVGCAGGVCAGVCRQWV